MSDEPDYVWGCRQCGIERDVGDERMKSCPGCGNYMVLVDPGVVTE